MSENAGERLQLLKTGIIKLLPKHENRVLFEARATLAYKGASWPDAAIVVTPHYLAAFDPNGEVTLIFNAHCFDTREVSESGESVRVACAQGAVLDLTFRSLASKERFLQSFIKVLLASLSIRGTLIPLRVSESMQRKYGFALSFLNPSQRFVLAYSAEASKCGKLYSHDVCVYYHRCLASHRAMFDFNEIPLFDTERCNDLDHFDFKPLLSTLRFCKFTLGISVENVVAKDLLAKCSSFFVARNHMKYLVVRNIGATSGGAHIAKKITPTSKNGAKVKSGIVLWDFSDNHVADIEVFTKALVHLDAPLKAIVMERMEMDGKALRSLFSSLLDNQCLTGIEELALSGNTMSSKTSKKCFKWLKEKARSLRALTVGPISDVSGLVHSLALTKLQKLVVCNTEFGDSSSTELSKWIKANTALKYLGLPDCVIKPKDLRKVLGAIAVNEIGMNLARIDMTKEKFSGFLALCKEGLNKKVVELVLDGNLLSNEEFKEFCKAGASFTKLRSLSIGALCDPQWPSLTKCLIALINSLPQLESISMCGNDKYMLKQHAPKVIEAMAENRTIRHINLQHNKIGNKGMAAVIKLLNVSTTVERIEVDDSGNLKVDAVLAYLSACAQNTNLVYVGYPQTDITRVLTDCTGAVKTQIQTKVAEVKQNILTNQIRKGVLASLVFQQDNVIRDIIASGVAEMPSATLSKKLHGWKLCQQLGLAFPFDSCAMPTEVGPMPLQRRKTDVENEDSTESSNGMSRQSLRPSTSHPVFHLNGASDDAPLETEATHSASGSFSIFPSPLANAQLSLLIEAPVQPGEPGIAKSNSYSEGIRKDSDSSDSYPDLELLNMLTRSNVPDSILDL